MKRGDTDINMVSIIIPALNEAPILQSTISVTGAREHGSEIIVADGGSEDATCEKARAAGALVVGADRMRARQMNTGARAASGDILLFLHADTFLPTGALTTIEEALSDPDVEAGAFRLDFDVNLPLLRFYSFCTRVPTPLICFGDRTLFVRRSVFEELGGFSDIPIFEDLDMSRRLHRRGGFRFLNEYVKTSARRFLENGLIRQQAVNVWLWMQYLLGVDPHTLTRYYRYRVPAGDGD